MHQRNHLKRPAPKDAEQVPVNRQFARTMPNNKLLKPDPSSVSGWANKNLPRTVAGVVTSLPSVLPSSTINARKSYYNKWKELLEMELECEMREVEARLKMWSRERLQREGYSLFGLKGKRAGMLFDDFIVKLVPQHGQLAFNRFTNGDMVIMTSLVNQRTYDGTIVERSRNNLLVAFKVLPDDLEDNTWRLDKGANRVVFDRVMAALEAITSTTEITPIAMERLSHIPKQYIPTTEVERKKFRSLIIDRPDSCKQAAAVPSRLTPLYDTRKMPPDFNNWLLNSSQRMTILGSLKRSLALIQGPPGTGKTHTAIHLIRLLCHMYKEVKLQILVCAFTNVATDNLLEGLLEFGIKALRVGRPVKVRQELRDATLDAFIERHPLKSQLDAAKLRHHEAIRNSTGKPSSAPQNPVYVTRQEVQRIQEQIVSDIVKSVQVICCTCIGAGEEILRGMYFPVVILDECTQATEPATLVPIVVGSAQHVIMLGDHHQLPPTVHSDEAARKGLSTSLFTRLVEQGKVDVFMLDTQYRMHPFIASFPSEHFYGGKLKSAVNPEARPLVPGFPWPNQKPIAFINVTGQESNIKDDKSKSNISEAVMVTAITKRLIKYGGIRKRDIGIITPYASQIAKYLSSDKELSLAKDEEPPDEVDEHEAAEYRDTQLLGGINISSVDGFQGREKEVIIFSAVRSNDKGEVGFLKDWRRLNVAITRAKRGLIIVGNKKTLAHDSHWRKLLDFIAEHHLEVDPQEVQKNFPGDSVEPPAEETTPRPKINIRAEMLQDSNESQSDSEDDSSSNGEQPIELVTLKKPSTPVVIVDDE